MCLRHTLAASPEFVWASLDRWKPGRHSPGMARKVVSRLKPDGPRHFIRAWRKHRRLTLEQVAERVGTNHGNLSRIERGLSNYTQPMLEALAVVLNCAPADLIIRDPSDPDGIWSIWDQLGAEQRRQVVAIAKTFRQAS